MDPLTLMLISGGISAVANIFGSMKAAEGQDKALTAETAANDKSLALQKEIFTSNKAGAKPWIKAGKEALKTVTQKMADGSWDMSKYGMDDLVEDPGYQFRLQQGERALDRAASARGKFLSGDQLKFLDDYNQESASQEFGNAYARTRTNDLDEYGRLMDASEAGRGSQAALSGVATNYANASGNILANQGAQAGAAAVNTGNIWQHMASGLATTANTGVENYMLYDRLAKMGAG